MYPMFGIVQRLESAKEVRKSVGLVSNEYRHEHGVRLAVVDRHRARGQSRQCRECRYYGHGHRLSEIHKIQISNGRRPRNGANPGTRRRIDDGESVDPAGSG